MAADRAIGRYRRWYGRLLGLYPRPSRERFAESTEQTLAHLLRERADDKRGLSGGDMWPFADTFAGIIR